MAEGCSTACSSGTKCSSSAAQHSWKCCCSERPPQSAGKELCAEQTGLQWDRDTNQRAAPSPLGFK